MGRAVFRLGTSGRKQIEEARSSRADDHRRTRAGEQALERQRRDRRAGGVERGLRERNDDVQSPGVEPALERREDRCVARRLRRAPAGYLSWNGYGVENPSDGGKLAVLTAASTH